MPPSTAAAKALMPGMNPTKGSMRVNLRAYRTPAAPPSEPPTRNVREIMALTLMPMRAAVFLSWDTARMALPTLVEPTR